LPIIGKMTSLQDDDVISFRDERMGWPHIRVFRWIGDQVQLEMGILRKREYPFPYSDSIHQWKEERVAELLGMKSKTLRALPTSNPQNHDFRVVARY
jgi:hypothetical protein